LPLVRRLEQVGIRHVEVNPAYSSKMGNLLWGWHHRIPDAACAAVEIGRRFLSGDHAKLLCHNGGNRRTEERQVQAPASKEADAQARGSWMQVWNHLNPTAGGTPRCTPAALSAKFPAACPRPDPFGSPRSCVTVLRPAGLAPQVMCIPMLPYL